MAKLMMIGTGHGGVMDLYNTCFVVNNEKGDFLVDTGGSIEIIKRLQYFHIDFKKLKHIFISHNHTDHILGLIWMFKKLSIAALHKEIKEKITVYSNDIVHKSIIGILNLVLPKKLVSALLEVVHFHILEEDEEVKINGVSYTFFDIQAKGTKQYGFECMINNKRLIFLGDETINPELYNRVRNSDYVMHEAFCLDKEESIFHAYEKNHSTVKSASQIMEELKVGNLILYHTEESHKKEKKRLYQEEGERYFSNQVMVPNDLDEIEIV